MNNKEQKISNPKVFGPGIWYLQHVKARDAITDEKKKQFIIDMKYICQNLPCNECRGHCETYMKSNPIENFLNIKENGIEIGMFKWVWAFHNAVNSRLKKPIIDWNTAKKMYYEESDVCMEECGGGEYEQPIVTKNNNIKTITGINLNSTSYHTNEYITSAKSSFKNL
jgi:hypothetical protein